MRERLPGLAALIPPSSPRLCSRLRSSVTTAATHLKFPYFSFSARSICLCKTTATWCWRVSAPSSSDRMTCTRLEANKCHRRRTQLAIIINTSHCTHSRRSIPLIDIHPRLPMPRRQTCFEPPCWRMREWNETERRQPVVTVLDTRFVCIFDRHGAIFSSMFPNSRQ